MIDMNNLTDTQTMFIQGAMEIVMNSTNVIGITTRSKDNPMDEKSVNDIINFELTKALSKMYTKTVSIMTDYNVKEETLNILKNRHYERVEV